MDWTKMGLNISALIRKAGAEIGKEFKLVSHELVGKTVFDEKQGMDVFHILNAKSDIDLARTGAVMIGNFLFEFNNFDFSIKKI